jgi:hypothetical protein
MRTGSAAGLSLPRDQYTKPDLTCGPPPVERGLGFVPRCLVLLAVRQHPLHDAGADAELATDSEHALACCGARGCVAREVGRASCRSPARASPALMRSRIMKDGLLGLRIKRADLRPDFNLAKSRPRVPYYRTDDIKLNQ